MRLKIKDFQIRIKVLNFKCSNFKLSKNSKHFKCKFFKFESCSNLRRSKSFFFKLKHFKFKLLKFKSDSSWESSEIFAFKIANDKIQNSFDYGSIWNFESFEIESFLQFEYLKLKTFNIKKVKILNVYTKILQIWKPFKLETFNSNNLQNLKRFIKKSSKFGSDLNWKRIILIIFKTWVVLF